MASILIQGDNGERYELEYNLDAIAKMEDKGFDIQQMNTKPMSTVLGLIRGAFIMHHPTMTDDEIDQIIARIGSNAKMVEELSKMYLGALSFLNNDSKKDAKNLKWEKH